MAMDKVFKLIDRIKRLTPGKLFLITFKNKEPQQLVLELNKQGQLKFGKLADGGVMPPYSEVSKAKFGKPNTRWQLFDTGDFYKSFKVTSVTENEILWTGDTQKEDVDLAVKVAEFGEIFGLLPESREILQREVTPLIREIIRKELNL